MTNGRLVQPRSCVVNEVHEAVAHWGRAVAGSFRQRRVRSLIAIRMAASQKTVDFSPDAYLRGFRGVGESPQLPGIRRALRRDSVTIRHRRNPVSVRPSAESALVAARYSRRRALSMR